MNTVLANDTALDRLARRRVKARLGWLTHATVYVCVIGGLGLLATVNGRHLPVGAALGWGLALAIHGARTLVSGSGLRERMVEAERRRIAARGERPAA
jgi:hypothetical protein